ncbi:molybdate ABC transporter substrate-binding protein [Actibacterium lipolyticum]|uniref:Molybdate-binding periplasmic protein n=1 Tax=Actibacterium lipolyticum TaxID=1524263 RepID=A0A238KK67_9RHOB|nr:molybdate ABC transporter substrate-binding protein [Actibacterium lipolyticum]SMX43094.1 Molybdate-binding periplasmic protein precursor [Actibacterium lipolyticum]
MRFSRWRLWFAGTALLCAVRPAWSQETVIVAVAANFAEVVAEIEPMFEAAYPYDLLVSAGSTGKLYAQVKAGAPFDAMLAADQDRPARLIAEGDAVAGTRFTYAIGQLTLWSPKEGRINGDGTAAITDPDTRFVAMANPALAPYGAAAEQAVATLGLTDVVQGKLVMGQNIGQTFSMVATGNADMGFVALSAVLSPRNATAGSRWDVPAELYDPIRQDAVLLNAQSEGGLAFLEYLQGDAARSVISRFGYLVE